jgi:hypothetical protein
LSFINLIIDKRCRFGTNRNVNQTRASIPDKGQQLGCRQPGWTNRSSDFFVAVAFWCLEGILRRQRTATLQTTRKCVLSAPILRDNGRAPLRRTAAGTVDGFPASPALLSTISEAVYVTYRGLLGKGNRIVFAGWLAGPPAVSLSCSGGVDAPERRA